MKNGRVFQVDGKVECVRKEWVVRSWACGWRAERERGRFCQPQVPDQDRARVPDNHPFSAPLVAWQSAPGYLEAGEVIQLQQLCAEGPKLRLTGGRGWWLVAGGIQRRRKHKALSHC